MTQPNDLIQFEHDCDVAVGLTKREYFAAMAMQGLLTRNQMGVVTDLGITQANRIVEESVIMADKIIEALNKQP